MAIDKPMRKNPLHESAIVANDRYSQQAPARTWIKAALITLSLLLFFSAILVTVGSGPQNFSARDNLFWLNSGWRILHGQIPHTDFSLATGTLAAYVTALGMLIRGPIANSIAAGQAAFGLILGALSFAILRRRTTPLLTALGAVLCGLVVMATRQPGESYALHSYAFFYNRLAEGLLMPFMWLALLHPRTADARINAGESLTLGALLVLLFFTKITYGLVGGALLLLSFLGHRLRPRGAWGVVAGIVLFSIALIALTGISPMAWWDDATRPFHLAYQGGTEARRLVATSIKAIPSLLVLMLLTGMAFNYFHFRGRRVLFLGVLACWGLALFIAISSQQRQEYLLPIALALILTDLFFRRTTPSSPRRIISLILLILLAAPTVLTDARSILWGWRSTPQPQAEQIIVHAPGLLDFHLGANQSGYANELNDAIALAAQSPSNAPILAVDYADGLAFALRREPPQGGAVFWYPGFSFGKQAHPATSLVFRGNPWLLITRTGRERDLFMEIYGIYLNAHYQRVAESPHFELWEPMESD